MTPEFSGLTPSIGRGLEGVFPVSFETCISNTRQSIRRFKLLVIIICCYSSSLVLLMNYMATSELNLNLLRIFEAVYSSGSMTKAAERLHLTQSGVSQHITNLEELLGVSLFERVRQRLLPTEEGKRLYESTHENLNQIENTIWELRGVERSFAGTINIGMPIEFGNNLVMPLISEFLKQHPQVVCQFNLGYASTMNDHLLKGELDFAIIDEFRMDRSIETKKIYDEVVELCASEEYLEKKGPYKHSATFYESLDYVEYQQGEPLLKMWFHHHLPRKRVVPNVHAYIMDVQGLSRLIMLGVGVGILPHHLVARLENEGQKVQVLKGCGRPLTNSIGIAKLSSRKLSRASQALFDSILTGLKKS